MGFFGWAGYTVALNYAFTHLPSAGRHHHQLPPPPLRRHLPGGCLQQRSSAASPATRPLPTAAVDPVSPGCSLGFLLCLAGVATIATEGRLSALLALRLSPGALAALFAAFAWGIYSNLGRFVSLRPGRPPEPASDLHSFLAMTFGLLFMLGALAVER